MGEVGVDSRWGAGIVGYADLCVPDSGGERYG